MSKGSLAVRCRAAVLVGAMSAGLTLPAGEPGASGSVDQAPAGPPVAAGDAPETIPAEAPARRLVLPPMTEAASVEEALDYTSDEREILADVRDGGTWQTTAFYVLLRRSMRLPAGPATLNEAEQPNPRDFWKEPLRYRGRLVRFSGKIPRQIRDWTDRLTPTPWWPGEKVYMVDVMETTTGQPMLVVMTIEPHGGINLNQELRFAGLFYKLATFPENARTGDPSVTHEYPIVVARQFYSAGYKQPEVPWPLAVTMGVLALLVVAFLILRGRARRGPGPSMQAALAERRRRRLARTGDEPDEVDEELTRQLESFRTARPARGPKPGAGQGPAEPDTDDAKDRTHPG